MSGHSVRNWAAGVTLVAAGYFGYTQLFETPETPEKEPAAHTITLQGGPAANPFGPPPSETVTEPSPAANAWVAATEPQAKAAELKEEDKRKALSFFRKFQEENTDYIRKFDYLDYAFSALGRDVKNAHVLGLDQAALANLIRSTSAWALQDLQRQQPQTAFEKLSQANNMRIAHTLSGTMDNGENNPVYSEQIAGATYDSINERKIALAVPAAKEVYGLLIDLTPEQVANLPDDDLHKYQTMANLVEYVVSSAELSGTVFQRKQDRYAAIGADRDTWYSKYNNIHEMIEAELKKRIDREFENPQPSPWTVPAR